MTEASLDQLRDIHLPPAPGGWTSAATLAIVLAACLAVALWLGRRWIRRRPLRAALHELARAAGRHGTTRNGVELARDIAGVLRRYAMDRFPGDATAGLIGTAWLQFLDARGGNGAFVGGVGALLETLPYRPPHWAPALAERDAQALVALAGQWLRSNAP